MDSPRYSEISQAIVRFLGSSWSEETGRNIEATYGPDVAADARAVYDAAIDCPVDWRTATMDSALDSLAGFLATNYPWLSPEARSHLNYAYIMVWK